MKKMFLALVAMFVMSMSTFAQSENNNSQAFDRLASYLELTIDQMEPAKTAMAQFNQSMEALYQLNDPSKGQEAWEKIQANHKTRMQKILNEKQYDKYVQMLDLTAKNTADRISKQVANK